jgi:hypothetical protein
VKDTFDQADREYGMRMAKAAIIAGLLSLSPGKNKMDRLKAQRTPLHPTVLTWSPSRVVDRAARVHALREAGRGIEATDSGMLHRSTVTDMRC